MGAVVIQPSLARTLHATETYALQRVRPHQLSCRAAADLSAATKAGGLWVGLSVATVPVPRLRRAVRDGLAGRADLGPARPSAGHRPTLTHIQQSPST